MAILVAFLLCFLAMLPLVEQELNEDKQELNEAKQELQEILNQ